MTIPVLVWFRDDLRLADNPALCAALDSGAPVIPFYLLDDTTSDGHRPLGGATRWWLGRSLASLADSIAQRGGRLVLRRGEALSAVPELAAETDAAALFANRLYGMDALRDDDLFMVLRVAGLTVRLFDSGLLHRPEAVTTKTGRPFRVFTPFWKNLSATLDPGLPLAAPDSFPPVNDPPPASDSLADWSLEPTTPDWAGGLRDTWRPGEAGAQARLEAFLDGPVADYASGRDRPDKPLTSKLSPHLRFGEISPRQVWTAARHHPPGGGMDAFLRELGWREFCHHLLFQAPTMAEEPLKAEFLAFPWTEAKEIGPALAAWQSGQTGYPIVDAGMRELWHTGWMHNRVRMIAASFLIKDLLIPWQHGERWFWDTLVDACPANNAAGWQWVAGCGADAAPFFRIFNPVTQGERFDPEGAYVRRWLPELADLPSSLIHRPWEAPPLILRQAGVTLGKTYPPPLIDHAHARVRALEALAVVNR
ncbi:deoxyribodipyrimidine photolyase [Rhodospirillum rubrum]|uniref:cryptochrome/photolyase family protein n=1 Tax=Rhodospirillum rubrum TaxID=1085 RepID=UPI0019068007|nr:deoxyribodipyrimidine photo-lyase [Rhodospirillum rubrum]MBK1663840.1 deoxyribodipyrimidine photolyase [Rhodospirillum rubrum]MBK1677916.1 deoxyribodipyrimidine photolyase [Rhodospirillum rubrum]